jgi:hypothetical protein
MTVHIGELRTDVRAPAPVTDRPADPRPAPVDEQIEEARERADWIAARTAAEGFDD